MAEYGFYAGDTDEGACRDDSDEIVIAEDDGWECLLVDSDPKSLLERVIGMMNDEELPDLSNHWFKLVEFPNGEIVDGGKVEL